MGRLAKPQRSGKNRKMKAIDPFYVGNRPIDRNADKYDRKPKGDDQEMPRSIREIIKLKDAAKTMKKRKRNRKSLANKDYIDENLGVIERGVTRPYKPAPEFKRRRGERELAFMRRVDRETNAVIQKAQFEEKYQVEVDELDQQRNCTIEEKSKKAPSEKKKRRLNEKRGKLKAKKQQKREDRSSGFERLKDDVKFGEVAKEPPKITFQPRIKNKKLPTLKPMLVKEIQQSTMVHGVTGGSAVAVTNRELGKSVKWKNLSLADRHMMNEERRRVVELYRKKNTSQRSFLPLT